MKAIIFILFFIPVTSIAQAPSLHGKADQHQSDINALAEMRVNIEADSIPPDHSEMRDLSSIELAQEMVPGWNVGNSLEAIGGETAWNNPLITQQLMDSVRAAGYHAVRIPVAWSNFMDTATYTISPDLLTRVAEVINYVLQAGMYAIINEHWDGGWMQPTYARQAYVNNRLAVMWSQIAVYFRDYDDRLLFAGMNEVMVDGDYGTPKSEYYIVHNSYVQTFVTTVRSTGGRNAYRYLAVQGFNTNIDHTYNFFVIPQDATPNRLLMEVHYYDPYNFTINTGTGYTTQWGNNATIKTDTWANESYADGQFQKMKTKFIDHGYGVILGEYGVIARLGLGSDALNTEYAGYRRYYMQYITRSIVRHGLVPFYWDNGSPGNNSFGLFNRLTGAQVHRDIIKATVDTNSISTSVGSLQLFPHPDMYSLTQNYPNPFNPSTSISFYLPCPSNVSLKVFDLTGKEIATIVSQELSAGTYSRLWSAANISSGVYFYQLQAGMYTETKKLVLIR